MRTYPRFTQETFPHTLVLANGAFPTAPAPLSLIDSWSQGKAGYTLTCCDGAVNKLRRYTELLPDAVIGDLDFGFSRTQGSLSRAHPALPRPRNQRPDQDLPISPLPARQAIQSRSSAQVVVVKTISLPTSTSSPPMLLWLTT